MELGQIYVLLAMQTAQLALVGIIVLFKFAFEAEQKTSRHASQFKQPFCCN